MYLTQKSDPINENENKEFEYPADRKPGHGTSSDTAIEGRDILFFRLETKMNLPYFKFMVQDWLAGDIQACSMETQGIYINIVARTWKGKGCLSIAKAPLASLLRVDIGALDRCLEDLISLDIIQVNKDGSISIKFVNEQLAELTQEHENKVLAGRKGGLKSAQAKLKHRSTIQNQNQNQNQIQNNKKTFTPPTLEELQSYITQNSYTFSAEAFLAFYKSKGWMIGKSKMKDWKAACRTWQLKNNDGRESKPSKAKGEAIYDC